jgi:subtilisin family serine protease
MAATVDQVMFEKGDLLVLFAAGNSGLDKDRDGRIDPNSIGTPGTAKNALTVGASENLLDHGGIQAKVGQLKSSPENWPVAPITDSTMSDNINGLAMFSSRGPTSDGRTKPDIVAPGTNILSVRDQQPGAEVLWGAYNQDYVFSGGTSMATPLTAGAAALTRQFLIEKMNYATPSAALVKAFMLHNASEMFPGQYGEVGAQRGQEILTLRPNSDEGYGRVNMAQVVNFGKDGVVLTTDSQGVATGQTETVKLTSPQGGHLVVNIVWTDAPGSVNASKALVNDLDLEVVLPNGQVLSANDSINNHSFVQADIGAGDVTIRIKGVNVPMGKNGLQPYALVASVK